MFKILVLQVVVAAVVANPIYSGGMGYGGMGTSTSTVSVRRTSVVSPGVYGRGIMPGMGVGTVMTGVYGTGTMGMLVDGKSAPESGAAPVEETVVEEKKETIGPNVAGSETVVEKQVETPLGDVVEVMKTTEDQAPMGQLRTGVVGGITVPGLAGSTVAEQRTEVVRTGLGGVEKTSVGESRVSTPFGSRTSVSSVQERTNGHL